MTLRRREPMAAPRFGVEVVRHHRHLQCTVLSWMRSARKKSAPACGAELGEQSDRRSRLDHPAFPGVVTVRRGLVERQGVCEPTSRNPARCGTFLDECSMGLAVGLRRRWCGLRTTA
jgi:hypothetical protein